MERRGRDVRGFLDAITHVCFLRLEDLQAATDERINARAERLLCPVTGHTILESRRAEQEHLLALPQTLPEPFDVQVNRVGAVPVRTRHRKSFVWMIGARQVPDPIPFMSSSPGVPGLDDSYAKTYG